MIIPAYIKKVMNILADAGYQVCIVGGAVRDSLRGVDINDYDLTTDAVPEVTASLMADGKVVEEGSAEEIFIKPKEERTRKFLQRILPEEYEAAALI